MSKKLRSFLGLVSLMIGGGLVYASSNDYMSASADSISAKDGGTTLIIVLFVAGIALIATGVMLSLFIFATSSEDK